MSGRSCDRQRPGRARLAVAASLSLAALCGLVAPAASGDLQGELNAKQSELNAAQGREGVLSSQVRAYNRKINRLIAEVAGLRNREAAAQAELEAKQAELDEARDRLAELRARLDRSIRVLKTRLVAIYKSDEPDILSVVLAADGYDDLLDRYEYLDRIQSQDSVVVARVRDLRTEQKVTVETVTAARDQIAAKKRELTRTRSQLEVREGQLSSARATRERALSQTQSKIDRLEGDISGLEDQIQAALAAAVGTSPEPSVLPAGPVQGGSAGFIWPVNGPIVSPFGPRWGRLHAGVDIAVPAGTPIRAAKAGTIALAAPYGGYGNYTCINHGGGLSTCYAHQSSFAITGGSVSQGDVIGYVGCTGHCFGDHLHFEVRINGVPTDPSGYL
jgi:murein DD-endopeptidase MepM/ murein hydrolase activator NlpD